MTKKLLSLRKTFSIITAGLFTVGLLTAGLLFCSQNSWAAKATEADEEIQISADHMQLNVETGNSVFTGNVNISQGELILTGEKVTLKRKRLKNGENEIQHITIIGHPARYNHVTDNGQAIEAESKHMVYSAKTGTLVMTTNARLTQPDNKVSSQKIIYDTRKKIVIAGAKQPPTSGFSDSAMGDSTVNKPDENQRVKITLSPKKTGQSSEQKNQ